MRFPTATFVCKSTADDKKRAQLGPKNTESSEAVAMNVVTIQDRLETVITTNPYLAQQKLKLEVERGRVTLRGVVNSFFQKQMAQEAVRHVDGVEEIDNELEVDWT